MATISLYASKINQMPGLINNVKKSVTDYKSELSALRKKTLTINKSVCNLDDVVSSIQTSTKTQEKKITSLDTLKKNSEDFITDVVRVDSDVADVVKKRKEDFYEKYTYLKPESKCEKDWKDYVKDWLVSAGEWCKEHWKAVVAIVLVIVAVVVIAVVTIVTAGAALGAVTAALVVIAKSILSGVVIGGLIGGGLNALFGRSFWEGFENGAFMGAISGIFAGGMGFAFTGGAQGVAITLKQTLSIGGLSGLGSQLISDLGDIFIKDENITFGQVLLNMFISGALGAAFAGIGYGLSKGFAALKSKFFSGTKGGGDTSWYKPDGSMNYPPNNGAVPGTEVDMTLKPGDTLGRYGDIGEKSIFVTQTGVDPSKLSLPPNTSPNIYQEFEVIKEIPRTIQAEIAPWGGSPGGGLQYELPKPILQLIKEGYIVPK